MQRQIRAYYRLTKPGIIYGNLFTGTGGFLFASFTNIDILKLIATLAGMAGIMASACVINNYLDRTIDKVMRRTQKRALVTGEISPRAALIYAAILGAVGIAFLAIYTNLLTTLLGIIGFISYSFVYTFAKRKTVHGTLIGTLPGALPPVAGYTAVTGKLDTTALILFLILVFWQMAHFYAIAIVRLKDYKKAKIPVMPVVYGVWATKLQLLVYASCFMLSIIALAKFSHAGILYLAVMVPLGIWWLYVISLGLWADDDTSWARKVFFLSLIMLPALGVLLSVNAWLP